MERNSKPIVANRKSKRMEMKQKTAQHVTEHVTWLQGMLGTMLHSISDNFYMTCYTKCCKTRDMTWVYHTNFQKEGTVPTPLRLRCMMRTWQIDAIFMSVQNILQINTLFYSQCRGGGGGMIFAGRCPPSPLNGKPCFDMLHNMFLHGMQNVTCTDIELHIIRHIIWHVRRHAACHFILLHVCSRQVTWNVMVPYLKCYRKFVLHVTFSKDNMKDQNSNK